MNLPEFNALKQAERTRHLFACCGSEKWSDLLSSAAPFEDVDSLCKKAIDLWYHKCGVDDWLQAFGQHPQIGQPKSDKDQAGRWSADEQARVMESGEGVVREFQLFNRTYEEKFGFIFIVFASGKSPSGMLKLLALRIENSREDELRLAMGEQAKITIDRMRKLFADNTTFPSVRSQITTHVLDTSAGTPGREIGIHVSSRSEKIAMGVTDQDGRVTDILPPYFVMDPGTYKIQFDTGQYFKSHYLPAFHPEVQISFQITDGSHYHIPLLISPFGYTTYRGS